MYVQYDIKIPEKLTRSFAYFPPFLKDTLVGEKDFGDLMKTYAEEEGLISQPRKMLTSSFMSQNTTLIAPLLLLHLHLPLVITKTHHLLEYTLKNCFNSFVQSEVDARRQGDENPNSSVVAERMKLLANSSYGHQIIESSRHIATKYISDKKHKRLLKV